MNLSACVNVGLFASVWLSIVIGVKIAPSSTDNYLGKVPARRFMNYEGYRIPRDLVGPLESYPNRLGITEEMRKEFHPVVVFPTKSVEVAGDDDDDDDEKSSSRWEEVPDYTLLDLTVSSAMAQLATEEERIAAKNRKLWQKTKSMSNTTYAVGRYDENRINLYKSDLFDDTDNDIDGFDGARTVHIGIDLDGPVGTKVYAFTDGVVHSVGYNPALGDYGNVVVVEHDLGICPSATLTNVEEIACESSTSNKVYALYGHLDSKSIKGKSKGKQIKKGQVLGRFGDIHENGGWKLPHVHFQLSVSPPETHNMPGAVSLRDRARALIEYPDPRLVLGPLY